MLARAMVDFLPKEQLQDILAYPNNDDPNEPKIRVVPAGKGKEIVAAQKLEASQKKEQRTILFVLLAILVLGLSVGTSVTTRDLTALLIGVFVVVRSTSFVRLSSGRSDSGPGVAKLLVSHTPDDKPPFIDATGAHAGALLGDVKHDPFQSGGLETPPHERVEVGAIHKANGGVLFLDEINLLKIESQHSLLTALQERKFPIVGQSERSAGAMVKTEPVPADFVLVAAGNVDSVQTMHPALRSRIRGYGYEVYVKTTMPDTPENRMKIVRFVAQEVVKDKKIPHFDTRRDRRGDPGGPAPRGPLGPAHAPPAGARRPGPRRGGHRDLRRDLDRSRRARRPREAREPFARAADRGPLHRAAQGVPDVRDRGRRRRGRQRARRDQRPVRDDRVLRDRAADRRRGDSGPDAGRRGRGRDRASSGRSRARRSRT